MSGKIVDLFGKKTFEELQEFAQAQFSVIQKLTKDVEQLKEEKKHLESLLKEKNTIVENLENLNSFEDLEKICNEQIRLLKIEAFSRQLTLEESKKIDTYHKILHTLKNSNKKQASPVDNMPVADLLQLVKIDETKNP